MRPDSVFDLASLRTVYTAILTLQLVDEGRLDLDAPVAEYLPRLRQAGASTLALLAHTSGPPVGAQRRWPRLECGSACRSAVHPTAGRAAPGQAFRYSSVGA